MSYIHQKIILSVVIVLLGVMSVFPVPANADDLVKTRLSGTEIDAEALFQTVGYIIVEHEKFQIPIMDAAFLKGRTFTRNTFISVHGALGESVSVSCRILGLADLEKQKSNARHCASSGNDEDSKQVISGGSFRSMIALTEDLFEKNGKNRKFISLEISYI